MAESLCLSPARTRVCVALLVVLGFTLGCSEFIVIGITPQIADEYGISLSQVGSLISVFAITYAFATPALALGTGRFKRFTLLVVYSVIFCLGNLLGLLAPTFEVLLVSRVLIGSVSGALLAVGVTYIPELLGPSKVSMTISVIYAAFSVAMVIATSAGKMIADAFDWHLDMLIVLVLCVAVCLVLVAILPREGATDEPASFSEQIVLLKQPCVLVGMAVFMFAVGAIYVFYGYVTPYFEDVLGMTGPEASAALMGYGAVTFFSNLLSGWADSKFGVKALIPLFIVDAAVLYGLYLVTPAMPASLLLIFVIGLLMYVQSVPCISMFMHTANRKCPKALTLASSLEPMSFNIGIAFGTAVGGAVVAGPGMRYAGLVGSAFSLVGLGLACVMLWLSKKMH